MRSFRIILRPPAFNDNPSFRQTPKELPVQALVPKLVVEALDVAVLSQGARRDVDDFDRLFPKPILQRIRDELRPVVTPDMFRQAIPLDGRRNPPAYIHAPIIGSPLVERRLAEDVLRTQAFTVDPSASRRIPITCSSRHRLIVIVLPFSQQNSPHVTSTFSGAGHRDMVDAF